MRHYDLFIARQSGSILLWAIEECIFEVIGE